MTARPREHMHLTAFMMAAGYYRDSWRLPGSRSDELAGLELVADLALMCEEAKLDSIFFGDFVNADTVLSGDINTSGIYEPLTTLAAIAARTSRIGLAGTISTSFSLPYVTARQLTGLDHMSAGRAGWNVVTSIFGAENFGLDRLPPSDERYRQACEFLDVAIALWDSWSDEAVIDDRERGVWADPAKIRRIDHEGEHYRVAGPMQTKRSPQGRPVLFQAGSSPTGMDVGARYADAIYTAQRTKQSAQAFRGEIHRLAAKHGRSPDSVRVLTGIVPIVGETDADAEAYAHDLADHLNTENGARVLADLFDLDFTGYGLDETLPAELWPERPGEHSRYEMFRQLAVTERFTLRQLVLEHYRSGAHLSMTGSASRIADLLIEWFEAGATDGFSLNPPGMPGGLERICKLLVPELQDRGYFREEYEGTTLREHLGLERPGAWDAR